MGYYLFQAAYTSEAWASLVKNPQDRLGAVRPVVESLGGSLEHGWNSFGKYDVVAICNMPDNVTAAAFSIAVSAGSGIKAGKTTPLLTMEEGVLADLVS